MLALRGAHVRRLVGFFQFKRFRPGEEVQRDVVAPRVRHSLSVSENIGCWRSDIRLTIFFFTRKNCVQDWNKPLAIPAGSDCFDKIDDTSGTGGSIRSMHKYKNLYASVFKQVNQNLSRTIMSWNRTNREPIHLLEF